MLNNKPVGIFCFPKAEGSILLLVYLAASFNDQLVHYGGRGRQREEERGSKSTVADVINCMWRT